MQTPTMPYTPIPTTPENTPTPPPVPTKPIKYPTKE